MTENDIDIESEMKQTEISIDILESKSEPTKKITPVRSHSLLLNHLIIICILVTFLVGLIVAGGIMMWLPIFIENGPVRTGGMFLFIFGIAMLAASLIGCWCGAGEHEFGV